MPSTSTARSTSCSPRATRGSAGSSTRRAPRSTARGDDLPLTEEMAADPISPYGVAKLAAERHCVSFSRVYHRFESVVLRYFNVFGPRQSPHSQYAAVIPLFITAIAGGRRSRSSATASSRATSPTSTTSSTRPCAPLTRPSERPHPQRRRRVARDGERRSRARSARFSARSRRSTICRPAPATSGTRGRASTRRGSCSASSRACTSTKASRAPCRPSSAD